MRTLKGILKYKPKFVITATIDNNQKARRKFQYSNVYKFEDYTVISGNVQHIRDARNLPYSDKDTSIRRTFFIEDAKEFKEFTGVDMKTGTRECVNHFSDFKVGE